MTRTPIYNTQEYKLAPRDKQAWAFTHKDNYISSADAAKKMGVKTEGRSVKVKTNTGEMVDVPVKISFHSIVPDPGKFKWKNTSLDGKKHTTVYMVKGSSPNNKTAVYFTSEDYGNSEDLKALKREIDDAFREFHKQHHEMLKAELAKSHAPMAKKAAKELPELAKGNDATQKVFDWFKKNGFEMTHVKPEDFKNFVASLKKNGHVLAGFRISSKADGWGHQTGESVEIDFANKRIGKVGWSSDD
jgi:hypothetical protein